MNRLHRATIVLLALALSACVDKIAAPGTSPAPATASEPTGVTSVPLATTASASLLGVTAPPGLRACWSADGYSRDAISNNIGTLTGSYTAGRPGFGQAFNFTAIGQGVTIPNSVGSSLDVGAMSVPSDGLTFAAWVLPRGTVFNGGVTGAGPVFEFSNGAHIWQYDQTNAANGLYANLASGPAGSRVVDVTSGMTWGTWHHVAVTYVRSTGMVSLYRDGTLVGSSSAFGPFFGVETRTQLNIGQRVAGSWSATGSGYTFNGAIDEVQVYGRGLTGAEIGQLYNATGTMCIGAPKNVSMVTQPVGAVGGAPLSTQPAVEIVDSAGTRVLTATNAVTVSLAPGSAGTTLLGTTTVTAVNGVATFTDLAVIGTGSSQLVFSASGLTSVTSAPFTITAPPATQLAVLTQPSAAAESGVPFAQNPVLRVLDAYGTLSTLADGGTVTATIASGVGGTLPGAATATIASGVATFGGLQINGAGTFTLKFTGNGAASSLTSATSGNIVVTQLVHTLRIVGQPGGAVSGLPLSPQPVVELLDAAGLRVAGASNAITTIASGPGTLSGTTVVNAASGLATFTNLVVTGPGSYSLTFSAGAGITPVTSGLFDITLPAATQLAVQVQPSPAAQSGVPFAQQPVIRVLDAGGALSLRADGGTVTAAIATGSGGTLAGTTTATIANGIASFIDLKINGQGTFTLAFSAAGLTGATSGSIVVTPPASVFTWEGFFKPVDNPPHVNKVEAGSTVAIKFSLGGNKGLDIFAPGFPASQPASCSNFTPLGAASPIRVSGGGESGAEGGNQSSGNGNDDRQNQAKGGDDQQKNTGGRDDGAMHAALRFKDGRYTIRWNTDERWRGTCRILIVKLSDGSTHTANFRFK